MAKKYGYSDVLRVLSENSEDGRTLRSFLSENSNVNVLSPTVNGEVFWENIAICNGWKFQRNATLRHSRILTNDNIRIAWGSIDKMNKIMNRLCDKLQVLEAGK